MLLLAGCWKFTINLSKEKFEIYGYVQKDCKSKPFNRYYRKYEIIPFPGVQDTIVAQSVNMINVKTNSKYLTADNMNEYECVTNQSTITTVGIDHLQCPTCEPL